MTIRSLVVLFVLRVLAWRARQRYRFVCRLKAAFFRQGMHHQYRVATRVQSLALRRMDAADARYKREQRRYQ